MYKTFSHCGSLLVDSCRQKAQVFFGCPVINMYGMTETSALVACQEPVLVNYIDRDGRPESTGIPLNGVTVKIMKYDQKKEAEPGETGLVLIATPTIMLGYIGQKIACFYSCDEKDQESVECKIQELCSMSLAQYEIPHYFIWREKFNYIASGNLIITNAL